MVKIDEKTSKYLFPFMVIGGALLAALLLSLIAVRPLYESYKKTNNDLKEKKAVLEKLEINLENLRNLDSKREELIAKNEKVLAALPASKDVPGLFVQLERIASEAGVSIVTISEKETAQASSGTETTSIVPVHYQVSGSARDYNALKEALKKIETGLRIISIESIDAQSNGTQDNLTLTLNVKTYSRGQ